MHKRACVLLKYGMALMLLSVSVMGARADVEPPDWRQNKSDKVWNQRIRPAIFHDRKIVTGDAASKVISLKAPYRAEDASVVPISIQTGIAQTADHYIRRIYVYIDKNPVPLVGIFNFTPASGRADLALRVRVDDFSYVRAIAEMNTGQLYMAKSFVRATGACSAPPPKSIKDSIAEMGKMKIRTLGDLKYDKPDLVQVIIKHPQVTGMQPLEIGSRYLPPAHFIKTIKVDYAGKPVMDARLTFSISMDPSFRFFFVPKKSGELTVQAVDTEDNHWTSEHRISGS